MREEEGEDLGALGVSDGVGEGCGWTYDLAGAAYEDCCGHGG